MEPRATPYHSAYKFESNAFGTPVLMLVEQRVSDGGELIATWRKASIKECYDFLRSHVTFLESHEELTRMKREHPEYFI